MGLLDIQRLTKEYRNKLVLDGVSLSIERRDRVCLIGQNGSGKSTLIRIALGLEQADLGQVTFSRGIRIGYLSQLSDELIEGSHNALFYEKLYTMDQHLRHLEEALKVNASMAGSPEYGQLTSQYARALADFERLDGYTLQAQMKKILLGLGLKREALATPLSKLSGGEKMRVALARILLEAPDLLILDEPTNHLDLKAIEWLEAYLIKFSGGVLLVSHDRYFLDRVGTRIAQLKGGTLVERRCSYTEFMAQQDISLAFYQKNQHNLEIQIRDHKALIANLRRMRKNAQADSREKALRQLEERYRSNRERAYTTDQLEGLGGPSLVLEANGHVAKEIAWARGLSKSFDAPGGRFTLFSGVDFNIYGGDRVAIIGPNGCGKTSLLNILRGLDDAFEGEAVLGAWASYAYLGQNIDFEDEGLSMLAAVMQGSTLSEAEARQHLALFQFYRDAVNSKIEVLSGGERVRLFLAQVMLTHPHVLILDEPTNHLDLQSRQALEAAINRFKGTVIAVSHDRYYLNNCADKLIAFEAGTARVYPGNYDAYLASFSTAQSQGLEEKPSKEKTHKGAKPALSQKASRKAKSCEGLSLEAIESIIATVEQEISALEVAIGLEPLGADYVGLAHLYERLEALYEDYEQVLYAQ